MNLLRKSDIEKETLDQLVSQQVKLINPSTISDEVLERYISVIKRKFFDKKEYFRTVYSYLSRKKRLNQGKKEASFTSKYKNIRHNIASEILLSLIDKPKDSLRGQDKINFEYNFVRLNKKELRKLGLNEFKPGLYSTYNIIEKQILTENNTIQKRIKTKFIEEKIEISYNNLFRDVWNRIIKEVLGDQILVRYLSKVHEQHQYAEDKRAISNDYIVHPYRIAFSITKELEPILLKSKKQFALDKEIISRTGIIEELIDSSENPKESLFLSKAKDSLLDKLNTDYEIEYFRHDFAKNIVKIVALAHDSGESCIEEKSKKHEIIASKYFFNKIPEPSLDYYDDVTRKINSQIENNINIKQIREMATKDFNLESSIVLAEIISATTKEGNYSKYIQDLGQSIELMQEGSNLEYNAAWNGINKKEVDMTAVENYRKIFRWMVPYVKLKDGIDNTERMFGISRNGFVRRLKRNVEILNKLKTIIENDDYLQTNLINENYKKLEELTLEQLNHFKIKYEKEEPSIENLSYENKIKLINELKEKEEEKFDYTSKIMYKGNKKLEKIIPHLEKQLIILNEGLSEKLKKSGKKFRNLSFYDAKEEIDKIKESYEKEVNQYKQNTDEITSKIIYSLTETIENSYLLDPKKNKFEFIVSETYAKLDFENIGNLCESVPIVLMKNIINEFHNYKEQSFEKLSEKIVKGMKLLEYNQAIMQNRSDTFYEFHDMLIEKIEEVKIELNSEVNKGINYFNKIKRENEKNNINDPMPKEDIDSLNKGLVRLQEETKNLEQYKRN